MTAARVQQLLILLFHYRVPHIFCVYPTYISNNRPHTLNKLKLESRACPRKFPKKGMYGNKLKQFWTSFSRWFLPIFHTWNNVSKLIFGKLAQFEVSSRTEEAIITQESIIPCTLNTAINCVHVHPDESITVKVHHDSIGLIIYLWESLTWSSLFRLIILTTCYIHVLRLITAVI